MPKLTIDGQPVEVDNGKSVMNAAEKLGISIPRFCYHPQLPVAGNCRMCLVEIEKFPKLATACTTPVMEGMVVKTASQKVKDGQRAVLEYLLVNHPLDCPICDKAGECMLQDQYYAYSSTPSRMADEKAHKPKRLDLGPTIVLDQERCVLCTRCVRFLEVFANDHSLGTVNRGDRAVLTTFPGKPLDNIYSVNTVDICPVGALTAKDFRFQKRVWFLQNTNSVCTFCANQCSTVVQHDDGIVYRILPRANEKVNGPWMCDTGRLEYHFVNSDERLKACLVKTEAGQSRTSWRAGMEEAAAAFASAGTRLSAISSPRMTNEALFQLCRLFGETLGGKLLGSARSEVGAVAGAPADNFLIKADKNPNTRGVEEILSVFQSGPDSMTAILELAESGKLPLLVCFDEHLLARVPDPARWTKALGKVKWLIVAATHENELTKLAHLVLPLAAWVEEEGTYTRFDGLVQRSWRAFPPRGEAKDALGLLSQMAVAAGKPATPLLAETVFKTMGQKVRFFGKLTYSSIGKLGAPGAEHHSGPRIEIVTAPEPVQKGKGARSGSPRAGTQNPG